MSDASAEAIDEVKEIAHNLRPYQLDRLGLTKAIEGMLARVADSQDLRLVSDLEPIDGLLPPAAEINVFRILQESVNNAVKHSGGTEVWVRVRRATGAVEISVGEAGDGASALALLRAELPNVAVLDIDMPEMDGLALTRAVREICLPIAIVLLTIHREPDFLHAAFGAGAMGYVLKDSAMADLAAAVEAVATGQHYTSPAMTTYLVGRLGRTATLRRDVPGLDEPLRGIGWLVYEIDVRDDGRAAAGGHDGN